MAIPFNPLLLDDLRQALGLTDLRASEHVWLALQAISAAGISIDVVQVEKAEPLSSADRTLQILQKKYSK